MNRVQPIYLYLSSFALGLSLIATGYVNGKNKALTEQVYVLRDVNKTLTEKVAACGEKVIECENYRQWCKR